MGVSETGYKREVCACVDFVLVMVTFTRRCSSCYFQLDLCYAVVDIPLPSPVLRGRGEGGGVLKKSGCSL